jgi:lipopolysaccharide export LptBFGC system permease protein LptF
MISEAYSWSLFRTATKNADSSGFLTSSSEGGQLVARASRVLIRASRPNQSRQFSQFAYYNKSAHAPLFPFRFLLLAFCFSRYFACSGSSVVHTSFPEF